MTAAAATTASGIRNEFLSIMSDEDFLQKVIVHSIKERVQEYADPLTSTLLQMANHPMHLVFCEAGLILFKTTNLPVFPYDKLSHEHRTLFSRMLEGTDNPSEMYHGCGKYTVQVQMRDLPLVNKRALLCSFVRAMCSQSTFKDEQIKRQLCDIIIQRFLSSVQAVSVSSEDIQNVMHLLWPAPAV